MVKNTEKPFNLHRTSVIRSWVEDVPKEAVSCLTTFTEVFARTGLQEHAIDAAHESAVRYFREYHEASYLKKSLEKIRTLGGDALINLKRWADLTP